MAETAKALAALAWPVIVFLLILFFRPAIKALIESAKSRKFTLKLGGQELTMEEVNQQQRTITTDLQTQVAEIRKSLQGSQVPLRSVAEVAPSTTPASGKSVLWVDDDPKNNSYFIQQLSDNGIKVELAMSTSEGLRLFRQKKYDAVISDMGRAEGGTYNTGAGIELLRRIREDDKRVPFIIFCSSRGIKKHGEEAASLGATAVTSSSTEMMGILQDSIGEMKA